MFSIFKKKSEIEILNAQYKKLMEEAYKLSTISRAKSDAKYTEADAILDKIQKLKK